MAASSKMLLASAPDAGSESVASVDSDARVHELPLTWNNTCDPQLHDHVRHYTGPLRAEHQRSALAERVFRARRRLVDRPTARPARRDEAFRRSLEDLTRWCQAHQPALVTPGR